MPPRLPSPDGINSIDTDKDTNACDVVSAYSTHLEFEVTEEILVLLFQKHLNDLIGDLCLSKQKIELLASKLEKLNLVEKDVKVSHYRKQNKDLSKAFKVLGSLCYFLLHLFVVTPSLP